MRLEGERALVTGAAGALGQVIVRALAREGAGVAGLDLDDEGLRRLFAEPTGPNGSTGPPRPTAWRAVDLTDHDAVEEAVAGVAAQLGGIDILVNAAGGGVVSFFHEMSYATWTTQIDRNLNTVFNATRAVLPYMLQQRHGRIISISSVAAISGGRLVRGATAYASAKAGVIGLTRSLAIEVAGEGITVNCIAPGAQDTPGRARDTPERREQLLAQIPTRLLGQPEHLAAAIVFLAAPEAENITGVVLPLDGGHSI